MNFKKLSDQEICTRLAHRDDKATEQYLRFYSTWFGGITDTAGLMIIPIDDHQVHRGDAVFEALRFSKNSFYDLDAHLDRLERSAHALSIVWPLSRTVVKDLLREMLLGLADQEILVRIFLSRGPGGFSPDPRESISAQFYIVFTRYAPISETRVLEGVTVELSSVPVKENPFHSIKSCNYLPNVMMKIESTAKGVDYVIGKTSEGFLSEGPTENILFLTDKRELVAPSFEHSLRGTTLIKTLFLAKQNLEKLKLHSVSVRPFHESELASVKECAMVGTTIGVLPVKNLCGIILDQSWGTANSSPLMRSLRQLLTDDMLTSQSEN